VNEINENIPSLELIRLIKTKVYVELVRSQAKVGVLGVKSQVLLSYSFFVKEEKYQYNKSRLRQVKMFFTPTDPAARHHQI